jgi:hypothetical protein
MAFYCDAALAAKLTDDFPLLTSLFAGYFHMDAYISMSTDGKDRTLSDEEVFAHVRLMHNDKERAQLARELTQLLSRHDDAVVSVWNAHAFCHNYNLEDAESAREFLSRLHRFLAGSTNDA